MPGCYRGGARQTSARRWRRLKRDTYGKQNAARVEDALRVPTVSAQPPAKPKRQPRQPKPMKVVEPLERVVQAQIIAYLQAHGWHVYQTSARNKGPTGTTPGVQDLIVFHDDLPPYVLIGLEVKRGPKSPVSLEQQILQERRRAFIVWDAGHALEHCELLRAHFVVCHGKSGLIRPTEIARLELAIAAKKRAAKAKKAADKRMVNQ